MNKKMKKKIKGKGVITFWRFFTTTETALIFWHDFFSQPLSQNQIWIDFVGWSLPVTPDWNIPKKFPKFPKFPKLNRNIILKSFLGGMIGFGSIDFFAPLWIFNIKTPIVGSSETLTKSRYHIHYHVRYHIDYHIQYHIQ